MDQIAFKDYLWPNAFLIQGESFRFVKTQREGVSSIYKSESRYLRIGDVQKIERDMVRHKKMQAADFPIPHIISDGIHAGLRYYIESSLGESTVSVLFGKDGGSVREEDFKSLIEVVERFVRAQIGTMDRSVDFDSFARGIHLGTLIDELPEYKDKIKARFSLLIERLQSVPFVLTHGDFNPHNIYPEGVIDFEDSFMAPFGYDVICALYHIENFPRDGAFEFTAGYKFSEEQKEQYLNYFDELSEELGFAKVSVYKDEYLFARSVWSAVRMQKWPHIQRFRYDSLIQKYLI